MKRQKITPEIFRGYAGREGLEPPTLGFGDEKTVISLRFSL